MATGSIESTKLCVKAAGTWTDSTGRYVKFNWENFSGIRQTILVVYGNQQQTNLGTKVVVCGDNSSGTVTVDEGQHAWCIPIAVYDPRCIRIYW